MENEPILLSPKQVSEQYPIELQTVYRRIKDGTFVARQVGSLWYVEKWSVQRAFYGEKQAA